MTVADVPSTLSNNVNQSLNERREEENGESHVSFVDEDGTCRWRGSDRHGKFIAVQVAHAASHINGPPLPDEAPRAFMRALKSPNDAAC